MRLLYALDTYRPNIDGVAVSSERLARGLAERGHEVAVVAPGRRFLDYKEVLDGIPVYRVRALRALSDQWWLPVMPTRSLERAYEDFNPDVTVVCLPFLLSRAAVSTGHRLAIPIVGITGTMPEWLTANPSIPRGLAEWANPTLWRHIAAYYNQCDRVVGVTETALEALREHGLTRPGVVISNGISTSQFRPRPRDRALAARLGVEEGPTVLYAGRLDVEKRMDLWLRAAAVLASHRPDVRFLLVGDGTERRHLRDLAARLGIESRVRFLGFLEREEYQAVFSLAHVFAIASPAELQSIVTLEAVASGLPVVGVRAGALPELVREGTNGYLFRPHDYREMAAKLATILDDAQLAQRMGRESRAIALRHDITRSIDRYEDLFHYILARTGGGIGKVTGDASNHRWGRYRW